MRSEDYHKRTVGLLVGLFTLGISGYVLASDSSWKPLNEGGIEAYQQGQYASAIQLFEEALSQLEQKDSLNPSKAATLSNLAAVHDKLGNFEEAKLYYQQSLTIIEGIQGVSHPDLIPGLTKLATLYRQHELFALAERLYRRRMTIIEAALGESHPHLIPGLLDLAQISRVQEAFERTEQYYIRALSIGETQLPPAHHHTQSIRMQYAALLRHLNRVDDANELESQASRELSSPVVPINPEEQ